MYYFYLLSFVLFIENLCASDLSAKRFLSSYPMIKIEPENFNLLIPVLTSLEPILVSKLVDIKKPYWIGKYEVSNNEWQLCYGDGACAHPAIRKDNEDGDFPVARVNWHDAYQFSVWISQKTNMRFRLPTEEEWVHAASIDKVAQNIIGPAKQTHRRETFGFNTKGIADTLGNVWEWTLSCWHASIELTLRQRQPEDLNNPSACTIRIVRSETRTHVSDIVSDTYNGGCGTLKPTANLGFRLIREEEK